ncbi:hypothetical protein L873DRAFT_1805910 [Choiromyces venosus 120613-1]|uniref:Uncharacterized protein n=1 Tax=Choiromyces venosus 120613-1 TaxID=1336337 RepID=A0A3N4JNK2_9PEZI|nr:hypothetical protein L873DRAFT_1805910 [Choiromyces venosus 120613-1]
MVFFPVTQEQLTKIDGIRETRYKSLRFMYLKDARATSRGATQGIFLSYQKQAKAERTLEGACQYRRRDVTKLKEPK